MYIEGAFSEGSVSPPAPAPAPFFCIFKVFQREKRRARKKEREEDTLYVQGRRRNLKGQKKNSFLNGGLSLPLFSPSHLVCGSCSPSAPHSEERAKERMDGDGGDSVAAAAAAARECLIPDADQDPPRSESQGTADTSSGSGTAISFIPRPLRKGLKCIRGRLKD